MNLRHCCQVHKDMIVISSRRICLPMQETWAWSLGWEDPLEKEMATHSSILAWRTPWTEEPGGLQSVVLQRIRHDWNDLAHTDTNTLNVTITTGYFLSIHTWVLSTIEREKYWTCFSDFIITHLNCVLTNAQLFYCFFILFSFLVQWLFQKSDVA